MTVFVFGAGKVGAALARGLRAAGAKVRLQPARRGLPRAVDADLVVLAVRDRELETLVSRLRPLLGRRSAVVHVAGALDAAILAPLREVCAGVGQMHPMLSFASAKRAPDLARGNMHVQGDPIAVARARRVARMLGMSARTIRNLDTVAYHAAAGLVANGAAALAAVGARLLVAAGVPEKTAPAMLGPLLRSVADNVETLGFPEALTGPVRRGDEKGVRKHLSVLAAKLPAAVPLYVAASRAQLPLARAIGEAPPGSLDAVEVALDAAQRDP
ncbi:MAG TPA: DUF2520 domain-containing protein [Polyangiaceae bacterium]